MIWIYIQYISIFNNETIDEKPIFIYIITILDGKSVSKSLQLTVKNVAHHF